MANVLQGLFSNTPRWAQEKIRKAQENRLVKLDLSGWGMGNKHKLAEIPTAVFEMTWLQELDLSNNQLTGVAPAIGQLQNLKYLDLRGNQLTTVAPAIGRLQNLKYLDLRSNQLTTVAPAIGQLQNLQVLFLHSNQLTTVPSAVTKLKNLQRLNLSYNKLTVLPPAIAQLQKLEILDLRDNQLTAVPSTIAQLQNLQYLGLSRNQLTSVSAAIAQLQNLKYLDLEGNQLTNVSAAIARLQNLQELYLHGNQLTTIPAAIAQLQNLKELNLSDNRLKDIAPVITQLQNLHILHLEDNPIEMPPLEVLNLNKWGQADIKKIRAYFRQLEKEGVDTLYEAKLIIVGEPGAGKTSLAKKLQDTTYQLNANEISTEGIDVSCWELEMRSTPDSSPQAANSTFRINIWDFGGQEIYHATHQFFLTHRSLYILVADAREQKTDFYYWFNVIELLSDNSPVLITSNEKQDRSWAFNEKQLRGQFDSLKEVLSVNLADADNRRLEDIIAAIKYCIVKLPHIGQKLPKMWVRVRTALELDSRYIMPLNEYLDLCGQHGFDHTDDKLQLSDYLHDLGVCLHFQDDSLLKNILILKPEWGTAAVYTVLESDTVKANWGRFSRIDLEAIWHEKKYAPWQNELLQLMLKFQLCYPLDRDTFIAPQLLRENQPDYDWVEEDNLILSYRYPAFMPKGILTQLIVIMHEYIVDQQLVWKTGVILAQANTRAEIVEYYDLREIRIRLSGMQKRDLLTIIVHELGKIHAQFPRLKYKQLIPCNCITCKPSQSPWFFDFAQLKKRLAAGYTTVQCEDSFAHVDVWRLIDDTGTRSQIPAHIEMSDLTSLLQTLAESFSIEEFNGLCFSLGIDYADLPAKGRKNKARELILQLKREGRLDELREYGRTQRPHMRW